MDYSPYYKQIKNLNISEQNKQHLLTSLQNHQNNYNSAVNKWVAKEFEKRKESGMIGPYAVAEYPWRTDPLRADQISEPMRKLNKNFWQQQEMTEKLRNSVGALTLPLQFTPAKGMINVLGLMSGLGTAHDAYKIDTYKDFLRQEGEQVYAKKAPDEIAALINQKQSSELQVSPQLSSQNIQKTQSPQDLIQKNINTYISNYQQLH